MVETRTTHSNRLAALIKQEIITKGPMAFPRFMDKALYTPGLGYYSAGLPKFGKQGDFTTAPLISKLFSQCLAKQCQQILTVCPGAILECGAGTGEMAASLLSALYAANCLPRQYYILEVSADLKQRQQSLLKKCLPQYYDKISWIDSLSNLHLEGIVIANEVLDAFPVHLFKQQDGEIREYFIDISEDKFVFKLGQPAAVLQDYVDQLGISFAQDYQSECNLYVSGWIKSISQVLQKGVVLIIDYGFTRSEYYHPDRNQGTLMCHYQHQAHPNPLIHVGLQDITAHVDFTAVAEAGLACSLRLNGYTTQAFFLLGCGITDLLQLETKQPEYTMLANEVKILTSPTQMGEIFKVIALEKNMDCALLGFSLHDMSEKL